MLKRGKNVTAGLIWLTKLSFTSVPLTLGRLQPEAWFTTLLWLGKDNAQYHWFADKLKPEQNVMATALMRTTGSKTQWYVHTLDSTEPIHIEIGLKYCHLQAFIAISRLFSAYFPLTVCILHAEICEGIDGAIPPSSSRRVLQTFFSNPSEKRKLACCLWNSYYVRSRSRVAW